MAEYAPGSWEVSERGHVFDANSPDDIICEPPMAWSDATLSWEPSGSISRWKAKARLIAAAPALLAACRAVLSSPHHGDTPSDEAEVLRAYIKGLSKDARKYRDGLGG